MKKHYFFILLVSFFFSSPLFFIAYQATYGENYSSDVMFLDSSLFIYIKNTFILLIGVLFLSSVFGLISAYLLSFYRFWGSVFFKWLLVLPLTMPIYIVAFIYTDLFEYTGVIQSLYRFYFDANSSFLNFRHLLGAIIVLSFCLFPYVFLFARLSFSYQSESLLNSSTLFGYSFLALFLKVILPLSRPSIIISLGLVGIETISEFGALNYFAVPTLTTAIYTYWSQGNFGDASLISFVLLLFVVSLFFVEFYGRRKQKYYQTDYGKLPLKKLSFMPSFFAFLFCFILFLLSFLYPCIYLFMSIFEYSSTNFDVLYTYILNSFSLVSYSVLIALVIALFFNAFARFSNFKFSYLLPKIFTLGYILPSTLLAVSALYTFTFIDHFIYSFMILFDKNTHAILFLSGSLLGLVLVYILRFTLLPAQTISLAYQSISRNLDMAGITFGYYFSSIFFKIHSPLLIRSILIGCLLFIIEGMKELSLVLILRPFDFETLTTYVYQYILNEQLDKVALPALLIVVLSIFPVIYLNKVFDKNNDYR